MFLEQWRLGANQLALIPWGPTRRLITGTFQIEHGHSPLIEEQRSDNLQRFDGKPEK